MTRLRIQVWSAITICLLLTPQVYGEEKESTTASAKPNVASSEDWRVPAMPVITEPNVETGQMGGVSAPSADVLKQMHEGQYILRAYKGELTKVPVEKILLPHDPKASPQSVWARLAPDGTVYVVSPSIICKSTDGGRTWTSHPTAEGATGPGCSEILSDGMFVRITGDGVRSDPVSVERSQDEGRTWEKFSQITLPPLYNERYFYRMYESPDKALILPIEGRRRDRKWPAEGSIVTLSYRSTDQGKTWKEHGIVPEMGSEGGFALLPSGKIFSTVRYQRPLRPGDRPGLDPRGYKNVFIADSADQGRTWKHLRQLCTVFGQTYGYPAALSDGTVVVVHDTRYGPGPPGSRAMISRDGGQTWLDEVYYLDSTVFTGCYTASVVLPDDTILTIAASSRAANNFEAVWDHVDFYAIRWKPVKANK